MRFVIDTNTYSDFMRNSQEVFVRFVSARQIFVPFIVAAELRGGFAAGTMSRRNEEKFWEFLSNERVSMLFADEVTTIVYADLYAQLRRQGRPIPSNDLWIASLAVQHSLPLFTRDKHFVNFPQLTILG